MKKLLLAISLILFLPTLVSADPNTASPVTTIPFGLNNNDNESGTIAVTNTFQSVFVANPGRSSCLIQNNSASNKMFVAFGVTPTPATTPTSLSLAAGASTTCENVGGSVIKSTVQITGTSGDQFYANQW